MFNGSSIVFQFPVTVKAAMTKRFNDGLPIPRVRNGESTGETSLAAYLVKEHADKLVGDVGFRPTGGPLEGF